MRLEQKLKPRDPEFLDRAQEVFERAPFIREVGFKLESVGIGQAVTSLKIEEKHMQQNNFVHAGVLSTMADHTAGCAGASLVARNEVVLSVEYKINLLRPAIGESLRCEAQVLRNGKTLIVVDSSVYATMKGREKLTARATVTLAVVGSSYD